MLKKALLLLSAVSCFALNVKAQTKCGTDEVNNKLKEKYPQIQLNEEKLEQEIAQRLQKGNFTLSLGKSTEYGIDTFTIPIVLHIVHDYGNENLSDNAIFDAVRDWNNTYNKRYADTNQVIAPFKKYIGKGRIQLKLATKDPYGNPTKGITRRQSQLTGNAGDFAKYDGWPNDAYLNLWIIRSFAQEHASAGAYAYKPAAGQAIPWYDGVICLAQQFNDDRTMEHEIGHCLNLDHVWGGTNQPNVACGDDNVDDTPPTKGHNAGGCSPTNLYDTTCSRGYLKVYPSSIVGIDSLVDYPDTNNSQNIMDYTFCAKMFTIGQVERMHAALQSNTAGRSNLWSLANLSATGALEPRPDLPPIADFYVNTGFTSGTPHAQRGYFLCSANGVDSFSFVNASWNDTITSVSWTFSNNAVKPTSNSMTSVRNQFNEPGWATVSLTATSNAGSNTISRQVYVADKNYKINPSNNSYYEEFTPGGDVDKWPMFNYYNNQWKWKLNDKTGYYDKNCIMFTGRDMRTFPSVLIDNPEGDFDDLFTPAFDLSGMTAGNCNLNYMYAGTAMSAFISDLNDSLAISYSKDCGRTWKSISNNSVKGNRLANNGNYTGFYEPGWMGEWALMSLNIPADARVDGVYFRFRYFSGVAPGNSPTGNNFYIDRINISNFPLGANTLITEDRKVVVAPNPTHGSANVIISGDMNSDATILVTDITGKVVYRTEQRLNSEFTTVTIPENAISVKGLYMIQVVTNNQSHTEKLVVY
jgi:PKD repeat protein